MALTAGTLAPNFNTTDQDGNTVTLSSLRGKKVVLYFYPKDMTPGCTAESCNLRDNYKALQKAGFEVFGISSDDEKSHKKFITKEKLPFQLLADVDKSVHHLYGTWVEKSMYGRKYMGTARTTYVIDEKGIITEVIEKVDTKNHAEQILGGGKTFASIKPVKVKKAAVKKVAKPAKKAAKKVRKK
ncbi:MAG: thioredoxin-dependent thiol peroxidase [Cytophagales bacterium]|jgi:peroxiredoxin Q/BCP|nr:thioredoxin-dependent thiol peroxidase [Cytophagales bacterium]MCA6387873.1 thioredoxin-dependent thiol peroxidase [Cytophagales bacterium]MCA6390953.1 thioredoxin-dependent thiol peroxidase [Cytophagales bacterium]MCA6398372.1 thioredoxin-dependent thiol peroxidase [Cytophagales bacterium]MCA6401567.1 thioredoxin-dependent thiol peroxidase [Cytophagales bacterium]